MITEAVLMTNLRTSKLANFFVEPANFSFTVHRYDSFKIFASPQTSHNFEDLKNCMEAISFQNTKSTQARKLFFLSVCVLFVMPYTVHADFIETFSSDIVVSEDSSFSVTEKFEYTFSGVVTPLKRCVSRLYREPSTSVFKERYLDVEDIYAKMDNADVPYTVTETRDGVCVTIRTDTVAEKGPHNFELSYIVRGAVVYQEYGGAELHFNVLGYAWNVLIQTVTVNVTSFDTANAEERACVRGYIYQAHSCGTVTFKDGVTTFQSRMLNPHEDIIITQGLNRTKMTPDIRERFTSITWYLIDSLIVLGVIVYGSYHLYLRRKPQFVDFTNDGETNQKEGSV